MTTIDLTSKPEYWDGAVAQLMRRDRILKKLIPKHPDIWLTSRGNPFITLARSIVGQQISVKAAESVWQRLLLECGKRPTPASVQKAGLEKLAQALCDEINAKLVELLLTARTARELGAEHLTLVDSGRATFSSASP